MLMNELESPPMNTYALALRQETNWHWYKSTGTYAVIKFIVDLSSWRLGQSAPNARTNFDLTAPEKDRYTV